LIVQLLLLSIVQLLLLLSIVQLLLLLSRKLQKGRA